MIVTSHPGGADLRTHLSDFVEVDNIAGLSEAEAAQRLRIESPNELPFSKPRSIWKIAWGVVREPMFFCSQDGFNFEFVGPVALADPVRPSVPEAIRECYNAGIRAVMINGDYPATARSIAGQIGLNPRNETSTYSPALCRNKS